MATTSEIQVTEAYIGLLGRAPDPDGLAYWVKQYDAAVAAGQDSTIALKKLMNDIALSPEYKAGTQGTNIPSSGSPSETQAKAIIQDLYTNLFGRAATTADETFWVPQLTGGSTTAPEMTINLITAAKSNANTTDADVLGFKQQGATYYVETATQSDFTTTNAGTAVSGVNGPITLQSSKDATDALATGTGSSLVVGTDTITMTLGDDSVTGDVKAGAYVTDTTEVKDASTADQDTLTLAATGDFAFGNTENIETITINAAASFAEEFDIDFVKVDNDTGTVNITTATKVTIAEVEVGGQQDIDLNNVRSDVNTTGVQDVDIDFDSNAAIENVAHTVNVDATADTVTITGANDAGITLIMANDAAGTQTVSVTGEDGTNDALTISANNTVSLDLNQAVANATLSGNTNEVTYTILQTDNATATDSTITLTGSKNVTISADAGELTGTNIASTATGTTTLKVSAATGNALDGSKFALFDNIDYGFDGTGDTLTLKSGQPLELSANQTGILIVEEAGTAAAGGSITVTLDGGTDSAFTAGEINTDHFESVSVAAGNNTVTSLIVDTATQAGNDADATIVGTNDISFAANGGNSIIAGAENVTVSAKSITLAGDVGGNDISLTATAGGITATAENAVAVDGGSIVVSATGPVAFATLDVDGGDIDAGENLTVSGNDVDVTGIIRGYDVSLTATNDSETSLLGGILTVGNNLSFTDGGWDVNAAINATGTITISGDAEVDVAGGITTAAAGVVITSTNDVSFAGNLVTPVLNAASASGAITVDFDGNTAAVTALTGSGNDNVTLDDGQVFTVETNGGLDTVTVTDNAAGTSIKTGAGVDTLNATDPGVIYTADMGAGNDLIVVAANSDATIDGGADTDKVTIGNGDYSDDDFLLKNIEEMVLDGTTTFSAGQFANDNTFELSGAQTLKIVAAAAGSTIDASNLTFDVNAVGNLDIDGAAGVDTLTGSDVVDVIQGEGGNDIINGGAGSDTLGGGVGFDTITTGLGTDIIKYVTATGNVDTITDFTTGTDTLHTTFATTKSTGASAVVTSAGVNLGAALAINTAATDVQQVTGVTLSQADSADEQKVIDAISNGTISITAATNKVLLSVVTSTNTYLYEVTAAAGNTAITAADDAIVLVGIFTNGVTFATNDIDEATA